MASNVAELTWVSMLLQDLVVALPQAPILHCDNINVLYLSTNLVLHARTKHIELGYHYIH